jgi:hypothetical protein
VCFNLIHQRGDSRDRNGLDGHTGGRWRRAFFSCKEAVAVGDAVLGM